MADIGPGTLVRCVRRGGVPYPGLAQPAVGSIYTVRDVLNCNKCGQIGFLLVEIVNKAEPVSCGDGPCGTGIEPITEPGFVSSRFVPLDDSRLDIFRPTSTDTPAKEPVAA